ncbi:MAG TPA: NUDIX domain-containing protein [Phycisphaerae bacterium]|nr:NUDIX domain-containing protein [Phycisphaerae bacterium]
MNKPSEPTGKRRRKRHRGKGRDSGHGHKPGVRFEESAGFVLFRLIEGQRLYLLLNYGKHWDYPKGHVEKGETSWQTALRELFEETGISQVGRVGRFEHKIQYEFFSSRKGKVHKTVTYFLGQTEQESVRLSDEHVGYVWLAYQDAIKQLTFDSAKEVLRLADAAAQ